MASLIITLLVGGIIAGLIQYFVDFKGLPVFQPPTGQGLLPAGTPDFWTRLVNFLKERWQFIGYNVVGIAGAFLVPVINEMTSNGLRGIEKIKAYAECMATPPVPGHPCTAYSFWHLLVLLGYAIIFGYSSVRIIRNLGAFLLGNINKQQEDQAKKLEGAQQQIEDLKKKLDAVEKGTAGLLPLDMQSIRAEMTPNDFDDEPALIELKGLAAGEACLENPKPWGDWRTAESLIQLRNQVNTLAPGRKKTFDGTIGDIAHQSRDSDHNPWVLDQASRKGVVTAMDITNDPGGKCSCEILAKSLVDSKDRRIKYVIWNRQIANSLPIGGSEAWAWRPYNGENPHDKHMHVSVKCNKEIYDAVGEWVFRAI